MVTPTIGAISRKIATRRHSADGYRGAPNTRMGRINVSANNTKAAVSWGLVPYSASQMTGRSTSGVYSCVSAELLRSRNTATKYVSATDARNGAGTLVHGIVSASAVKSAVRMPLAMKSALPAFAPTRGVSRNGAAAAIANGSTRPTFLGSENETPVRAAILDLSARAGLVLTPAPFCAP